MPSKRNGEIDFLRFVFAIILVFFHFNHNYKLNFFSNGYIGVEFFFVVSGYLMVRHVSKMNSACRDLSSVADETWRYLLAKAGSFYSYYLSAILLQIVFRNILVRHEGIAKLIYDLLQSIPTFSLTFMSLNYSTGVSFYVGNTWYLSCMLIAIFLLYPLLLRSYKFSVKIIFPFLTIFILGYSVATNKTIAKWGEWSGLVYFGVLRAVAEMALGGVLFQLSETIATKKPKLLVSNQPSVKFACTLAKIFCYAVVLVFAYGILFGKSFKAGFNLHALLFCSLGILLSFSNVGYSIPDSRLTRYLGKISLPIFIYHGFIRLTLWDYIGHSISVKLFTFLIIMSIIASVLLMYLTDFFAVRLKRIAEKL